MVNYLLMKKAEKPDGDSLTFLCGARSLCLNRKKVRMTVRDWGSSQPSPSLTAADACLEVYNRTRIKCWFPNRLSQHPETHTDGLTQFHNSVAKQPSKNPFKMRKRKTRNKTLKPHRSPSATQLPTVKLHTECGTLKPPENTIHFNTCVCLFVWVASWRFIPLLFFTWIHLSQAET